MCGIVGYVGKRNAAAVLRVALERLEYRGYDSCGIATINNGELDIRRKVGKLRALDEILNYEPLAGEIGIAHTRWATHGVPSDTNTHPIFDCSERIALVHNGEIENYRSLKEELLRRGHLFRTDTDSEVIVHLIEEEISKGLVPATLSAVQKLNGSFSIALISKDEPAKIVAAKKDTPLIIGVGRGENLIASDYAGVINLTKNIIDLPERSIVVMDRQNYKIIDFAGKQLDLTPRKIEIEVEQLDKGSFAHFMLKEIFEQPTVIKRNLGQRVKDSAIFLGEELKFSERELKKINRIIIQACGTSWHAGLIGKYLIEKLARIHTEVEVSSEFRYRDSVFDLNTMVMAISQSGETADTLAGLREAKAKFLDVLSIVNVNQSSIDRESDGVVYINAGPEIGVASTKAYTAEIINVFFFAMHMGKLKGFLPKEEIDYYLKELMAVPEKMSRILDQAELIKRYAEEFYEARDFIFLGRGLNYPSALEGALKLKEISYIHATGYAGGEMKHGPIALIDEHMPVVGIVTKGSVYDKMMSNIEEVAARRGIPILIGTEGDKEINRLSRYPIFIAPIEEILSPLLVALPLQLLAYFIALKKNCDVDRPRNLAKSVTVE